MWITRLDCIFACNEAILTFLGGNERREFVLSNDAKIIEKDWIGVILDAIWIDILKCQMNIHIMIIILLYNVWWFITYTSHKVKKETKMNPNKRSKYNRNHVFSRVGVLFDGF